MTRRFRKILKKPRIPNSVDRKVLMKFRLIWGEEGVGAKTQSRKAIYPWRRICENIIKHFVNLR